MMFSTSPPHSGNSILSAAETQTTQKTNVALTFSSDLSEAHAGISQFLCCKRVLPDTLCLLSQQILFLYPLILTRGGTACVRSEELHSSTVVQTCYMCTQTNNQQNNVFSECTLIESMFSFIVSRKLVFVKDKC